MNKALKIMNKAFKNHEQCLRKFSTLSIAHQRNMHESQQIFNNLFQGLGRLPNFYLNGFQLAFQEFTDLENKNQIIFSGSDI